MTETNEQTKKNDVKFCAGCNKIKSLHDNFYKAGKVSYQKHCKTCHNVKRREYIKNNPYLLKGSGYKRLPKEIRDKIEYDRYIKINFKNIYKKHKDEYPKLNYQTLLRWHRQGQIPEYKENDNIKEIN